MFTLQSVTGSGFWQGHPGAAQVLLDAVLAASTPGSGECALDLYSGVGLFSAGLAARVGPSGLVIAVEGDHRAASDARRNLHDTPQVRIEHGRVERVLPRLPGKINDVVADDFADAHTFGGTEQLFEFTRLEYGRAEFFIQASFRRIASSHEFREFAFVFGRRVVHTNL